MIDAHLPEEAAVSVDDVDQFRVLLVDPVLRSSQLKCWEGRVQT